VPLLPRGGSIIFTTSGIAQGPNERAVDYGASKAALSHMIHSLARQLAPRGLRVNGVAPGLTYSPFLATVGFTDEIISTGLRATPPPFGRIEQPAELAPLFVSLADPSGTYISGNVYSATGATSFP
jgi:NAD(P)-dependent dehydrogenase (short-subunit alcohol dehydrogenase family)